MRDRYIILSVLLIVCFLAPVDAYTNHSLEWGVESGVKYWYSADFYKTTDEDLDGEIDEVIDLNVNYYGMIEQGFPYDVRDNVTLMQDVWGLDTVYLEDGTRTLRHPFYILPIGNWSLLTLLLPEFLNSHWSIDSTYCVFFDNETTWGYRYESPNIVTTIIRHEEYSKEDGALSYFFQQYSAPGAVTNQTQECRRIEPDGISQEAIVISVSIVASLTLAVVVLVIINRRKRS